MQFVWYCFHNTHLKTALKELVNYYNIWQCNTLQVIICLQGWEATGQEDVLLIIIRIGILGKWLQAMIMAAAQDDLEFWIVKCFKCVSHCYDIKDMPHEKKWLYWKTEMYCLLGSCCCQSSIIISLLNNNLLYTDIKILDTKKLFALSDKKMHIVAKFIEMHKGVNRIWDNS